MGEEAITSGRQKALREATILLDLAIIRSRGSLLDAGLRSALEKLPVPACTHIALPLRLCLSVATVAGKQG
jgi:hypothetical protein